MLFALIAYKLRIIFIKRWILYHGYHDEINMPLLVEMRLRIAAPIIVAS